MWCLQKEGLQITLKWLCLKLLLVAEFSIHCTLNQPRGRSSEWWWDGREEERGSWMWEPMHVVKGSMRHWMENMIHKLPKWRDMCISLWITHCIWFKPGNKCLTVAPNVVTCGHGDFAHSTRCFPGRSAARVFVPQSYLWTRNISAVWAPSLSRCCFSSIYVFFLVEPQGHLNFLNFLQVRTKVTTFLV